MPKAQLRVAGDMKEEAFQESNILGSIDEAVIAIDTSESITFMNRSAETFLSRKPQDSVGRHVTEVLRMLDDQPPSRTTRALARLLRKGGRVHFMTSARCRAEAGAERFLECSATPIKDAQGTITGAVLVCRDITERRQAEEDLRARARQQAQEAERRRIARDLHDETGQLLPSLLIGLRLLRNARLLKEAKAQANYLGQITRQILDNLQRVARGLHPGILDDLGLVAALTRYGADYAQACGLTVHIQTEGLDSGRLPFPVETTLYRIVQEALANIAKHAAAKTVSIALRRHASEVQATVHDDGCGFDVETILHTSTAAGHLGLYGMRERAALLGGGVTIESSAAGGTMVSVHIPLGE